MPLGLQSYKQFIALNIKVVCHCLLLVLWTISYLICKTNWDMTPSQVIPSCNDWLNAVLTSNHGTICKFVNHETIQTIQSIQRKFRPFSNFFQNKYTYGCIWTLTATVCENRESHVSCENFNFLIFCPKDPLGKLFSKVAFKISKDFYFLRNREKLKLAVEGRRVALTAIGSDQKLCIFSALAKKIGK